MHLMHHVFSYIKQMLMYAPEKYGECVLCMVLYKWKNNWLNKR